MRPRYHLIINISFVRLVMPGVKYNSNNFPFFLLIREDLFPLKKRVLPLIRDSIVNSIIIKNIICRFDSKFQYNTKQPIIGAH